MKKNLELIFLFAFLLVSQITLGQMIPSTSTIKTPHGNVTTTTWRQSPMVYGNSGPVSYVFEYNIVLLNDSMVVVRAKIDLPEGSEKSQSITVRKEGVTYFPKDTKAVNRISREHGKIEGIPADSCWLFKIYKGAINGYSYLPNMYKNMQYVIAIQKGDEGPILPMTKENVVLLIGTEDERTNWFVKHDLLTTAIERYNRTNKKRKGD